jgi:hypothetical protein
MPPKRLKQTSYAEYDDDLDEMMVDIDDGQPVERARGAQNISVCSYRMGELRKAVVQKRRVEGVTGANTKPKMVALIEMHRRLEKPPADLLDTSLADLRVMRDAVIDQYHTPAPSKMTRDQLVTYIYFTASQLNWPWTAVLRRAPKKTRITRACLGARAPGTKPLPPTSVLSRKNRPKRQPSAYNEHIRVQMLQTKRRYPDPTERFQAAVAMWNERKDDVLRMQGRSRKHKENRAEEAEERAERVRVADARRKSEKAAAQKRKKTVAAARKRDQVASARRVAALPRIPRKRNPPSRYSGNGMKDIMSGLLR